MAMSNWNYVGADAQYLLVENLLYESDKSHTV